MTTTNPTTRQIDDDLVGLPTDLRMAIAIRRDNRAHWSRAKVTKITAAWLASTTTDLLATAWEAMDSRANREIPGSRSEAIYLAARARVEAEIDARGLVRCRAYDGAMMVGRPADFIPCHLIATAA